MVLRRPYDDGKKIHGGEKMRNFVVYDLCFRERWTFASAVLIIEQFGLALRVFLFTSLPAALTIFEVPNLGIGNKNYIH